MICWDFAARAWERPGVAALALALQTDHDQSVALLLWALWTAHDGRTADEAALAAAVRLAQAWDEGVIAPLRTVRRRLTAPLWPADREAAPVRARVLAAELAAERALMEALEVLAPEGGVSPGPAGVGEALARLGAVSALWRSPAPAERLAELAAAVWT